MVCCVKGRYLTLGLNLSTVVLSGWISVAWGSSCSVYCVQLQLNLPIWDFPMIARLLQGSLQARRNDDDRGLGPRWENHLYVGNSVAFVVV
ncbi:hypothetical protein HYPSUDRAFT_971512 [Hypholoma sublateritium FD-334 SS-4]|uniref:Uncharacterized protein n=1 Tax=Hypholoma sublateritium (strain FD-334 SS-4) TaxID=945553 RepID=A0A0D2M4G8_HYPSF|nr:hypothetical protein HYPSUDRAFT_971512 [Hypholoma sublateritium FD-334 SS-4]